MISLLSDSIERKDLKPLTTQHSLPVRYVLHEQALIKIKPVIVALNFMTAFPFFKTLINIYSNIFFLRTKCLHTLQTPG